MFSNRICDVCLVGLVCVALTGTSLWAGTTPKSLVFVKGGVADAKLVCPLGGALKQGKGHVVVKGLDTHLVTRMGIGAGEFHVKARLSIHGLRRSAAAFKLGHTSSFGFEGGHGKMYITGPVFKGARGKPIGNPADFLKDERPFEFEAIREGKALRLLIDGKKAYEQTVATGALGCMSFTGRRSTLHIEEFSATANFVPVELGNVSPNGIWLHPRVRWMSTLRMGPYVTLADGGILTVEGRSILVSRDHGKTWKAVWSFPKGQKMAFSGERAVISTRKGVLVSVFLNQALRKWGWDSTKHVPIPNARSDVWSVRSLDDGKTWGDAVMLYGDSYSGCIRGLVEASNGNLVASVQGFRPKLLRHATMPYVSTDAGKTWRRTDKMLDLPGKGHHDGVIEGTLMTLKDGRVWNLLRTSYDQLYSSFSADGGVTWSDVAPSGIDASDGPPVLLRLADGRVLLLWNRIYPEGKTTFRRSGGSERTLKYVSNHREELALTVSSDEGKTWTKPVVLARNKGSRVSYPYAFEHRPGELWATTMQGGLRIGLTLADFVKPGAETRAMKDWPW